MTRSCHGLAPLQVAAASRRYDMTCPTHFVRHSCEEALQACAEMSDVATCALCSGKIHQDSPTAVFCANGNSIIHGACRCVCREIVFAQPNAPKFNLECPMHVRTGSGRRRHRSIDVCVGFSVGDVRTAALADIERVKENK